MKITLPKERVQQIINEEIQDFIERKNMEILKESVGDYDRFLKVFDDKIEELVNFQVHYFRSPDRHPEFYRGFELGIDYAIGKFEAIKELYLKTKGTN